MKNNPTNTCAAPSVSIATARSGASSKANALGMRAMQERAYARRGEQYLLIKSPPASGKSRALMFIALDKLWCEHALTIGYRSSLTEIVQIIGRATRDAPGKERARFTNLIAEPAAEQGAVAEAVNDMLEAISASLLMEQVLAPRYEFTPKGNGPKAGFDYGEQGYQAGGHKIGVTGGKVEKRIANAKHDATYLLADVEVVATYKLSGIDRSKMEGLFHRIFAAAQIDLTLEDRFGQPVKPREWFLVPLNVIDQVVQSLLNGNITEMVYDPAQARLVSCP